MAFEHVLTPIEVGGMTLRNRLMMTTHGTRLSQRRYLGYLAERADQVGLVGISASLGLYDFLVGPRGAPGDVGDFDAVPPDPLSPEHEAFFARYTDTLREQAAAVQEQGTRCVGQLVHLGAASHSPNLQPDLAPSDVPDGFRRVPPHTLTREEIDRLLDAYVVTARRIRDAGMDGIEIHAAHGYLVQQFLSPLTNHRTDEHGGSLENRMRFLLDLLGRLRDAVGDLPIGIRVSGSEEGGLTADDVAEIARRVAARGIAYVNVSGGTYTGWGRPLRAYVAPATSAVGVNVADAAVIRRAVSVPVIVAGRILDLATAERIVADGSADMVGFTRALIAEPKLVTRTGAGEPVAPCIGGNECHYPDRAVVCAVNPAAGREEWVRIGRAARPRRVVVVGGGPGGFEAARGAARRGHDVVLVERDRSLGGALRSVANERPELRDYLAYLDATVARLPIRVMTGVDATAGDVLALEPDVVVLATGAAEVTPATVAGGADADYPGAPRVVTALPVLDGSAPVGESVLVVAGLDDYVGPLVVAAAAARRGASVRLVAEPLSVGESIEPASRLALVQRLLEAGVVMEPLSRVAGLAEGGARIVNPLTGAERFVEADTVVFASERRPRVELLTELDGRIDVRLVGDCLAPRRILHATLEGFRVALDL